MIAYSLLFLSVFSSVSMLHYLIHMHLKHQDKEQPDAEKGVDTIFFILFSALWVFTIYLFKNNL